MRTARVEVLDHPDPYTREDAGFAVPQMRVWLVVGVHPTVKPHCWVMVAREGGITFDLMKARLFAFSSEGRASALEAAGQVFHYVHRDWRGFTAKVLVTGPPEDPIEVVTTLSLGDTSQALSYLGQGESFLRGRQRGSGSPASKGDSL